MHFYESSIITTKDGLHCQVYGNEHSTKSILVKPKYIPMEKLGCSSLQCRFISGKRMNRLNMWTDKEELKRYISEFGKSYPNYVFHSDMHKGDRLFFSIPVDNIERIYFPRRGFSELMSMPENSLDEHLKLVYEFGKFLLKSGFRVKDFGITYSTLMGHYMSNISDINIVVYGKENYWKLMSYLEENEHEKLRWKTKEEWLDFYNRRNRFAIFDKGEFVKLMSRKKSEGFFGDSLFVIFAAEKEEETWFKWGEESYEEKGFVTVRGEVTDNFSSVVRPGCYEVKNCNVEGVKKIVFYSRDYCMLAFPGEKIEAAGILEEVTPKSGEKYYRVVVGYFDSYISDRREKEYIKGIKNGM